MFPQLIRHKSAAQDFVQSSMENFVFPERHAADVNEAQTRAQLQSKVRMN
jgi:hypothetical protein